MLFKEYKDTLSETDQLTDEEFKEIETSLNEDAKTKIEKCDNRLKFLKQSDTPPKLRELDDEFFQLRNNSEFVNGTEAYRVRTIKGILNKYDQDLLEKWNDVLKKFGGEFITENALPFTLESTTGTADVHVDRESMDHISTETSKPKDHRKSTQSSNRRQVTTNKPSIETPSTTESTLPNNGNATFESDKAEIDSLVSDLLALINFPIVSHSPFYSLQRMANTTIRNICCQARRAAHHGEYHSKYCDPYAQRDSIARMKRSYSIYSAASSKSYGNGPMYFPNQRRTEGHKKLNRRQRKFLRLLRGLNSPLLNRIKNATKLNELVPLENICSYIDIQTNGVYPQKILDSWDIEKFGGRALSTKGFDGQRYGLFESHSFVT
ncbi:hypothetical protein WR25_09396 [Diploscapter pachys]|uniref:Uncharacterized protein n=1 Tax=Diploscapter pachys TaxID=2018661 RepID=A0A2A2JUJ9_9BILA|nr:hypothetical protein WR25_09396 [Diploscapter pachys]